MKKSVVSSFDVDHRTLREGLYLRSTYTINEQLAVLSWDLRFCAPMDCAPLSSGVVHTIEHLMAYYLRLDEPEKDILLALMPQPQRKRLLRALERKLSMSAPGNGIACSLPLFAISSCAVACLQQESSAEEAPCQAQQPQARQEHNADQESADTLKEEAMSMNIEHSMIITLISPEYTEIVIQAAKAAGAAGGTVCKAIFVYCVVF